MDWLKILAQAPDVTADLVTTVFEKGVVPGAVIIAMAYVIIRLDKRASKREREHMETLVAWKNQSEARGEKLENLLGEVTTNQRIMAEKIESSKRQL